ncbi:MAG: diaminopimelate decarboxylase [Oligoflexales bacterium]|nr:diaminopimelate decarboxylase [Oligoflexales bacterium]
MDYFLEKNGQIYCESVPLAQIAAEVGTPCYVYSLATLNRHAEELISAFKAYPTLACFAVKANSHLAVLKQLFSHGLGADVVSGGEMARALKAGCPPEKIVFSGVGKRKDELEFAIQSKIMSINLESIFELDQLAELVPANQKVRVSLRLNVNVDAKTNPKIATGMYSSKFGIAETELANLLDRLKAKPGLQLVGLACHIGSQMTSLGPLSEAAKRIAELAMQVKTAGFPLEFIDVGGGLGIKYHEESPPNLKDYAQTLQAAVAPTGLKLVIEPGRVLVGNVGVIVTRVLGIKATPSKKFVVVDAAMNDLMRPSIYDAYHAILPVNTDSTSPTHLADIVGPVCESGDVLGRDRSLPNNLQAGDLVFIRSCGAYAASMASNYNTRPRAPEVLVDQASYKVIKPRESLEKLWSDEAY